MIHLHIRHPLGAGVGVHLDCLQGASEHTQDLLIVVPSPSTHLQHQSQCDSEET